MDAAGQPVLPAPRYIAVFAAFMVAWGLDGANSYLTLFSGLPHLYEPHNMLRLLTGTLEGLALSAFLVPVLNITMWAGPVQQTGASVENWLDIVWLLVGGGCVVLMVGSAWAPLLYPLALLSGAMVVALVGAVNGMVVLALLRRDGMAGHWLELIAPSGGRGGPGYAGTDRDRAVAGRADCPPGVAVLMPMHQAGGPLKLFAGGCV